jgi:Zn-dependent peptidase ImmA (M78 family)
MMDWRRRKQIQNLVNGILQRNALHQPPILLIVSIMTERSIKFAEIFADDEEFCGVYLVDDDKKAIIINSNMYEPRKNFTIAHELGHHYLNHKLDDGVIACDNNAVFGKNKPEREKEADYFASCFLMPESLMKTKAFEFKKSYADNKQFTLLKETEIQVYNEALNEFLRKFFRVSKEAMGYRLEEIELVRNTKV